MPEYVNSKIYKIVCNTSKLVYIGSTTEPTLARRLAGHVSSYKFYLKGKRNFVSSFEILENNNFEIVLLENVNCNCRDELRKKEREYIEINTCVNRNIPSRKQDQDYFKKYYEVNKPNYKKYYEENKEYKREYARMYARLKAIDVKEKFKRDLVEKLLEPENKNIIE